MQGKLSEVSNPNISDAGSKNVTENKKKSRKPAVIAVASVAAWLCRLVAAGSFGRPTRTMSWPRRDRRVWKRRKATARRRTRIPGWWMATRPQPPQITVKQVADAKTVDALAEALKANEPDVVACVARFERRITSRRPA